MYLFSLHYYFIWDIRQNKEWKVCSLYCNGFTVVTSFISLDVRLL